MWRRADGACEACGSTLRPGRGGYAVDHDHTTGTVRGLLCASCNTALGLTGECPERLRLLAGYVRLHATADGASA